MPLSEDEPEKAKQVATITGWIGVDLDGTLAEYDGRVVDEDGAPYIGQPILPMVSRVRAWYVRGIEVRIFTARVFSPGEEHILTAAQRLAIEAWCEEHIGHKLPVTCTKDFGMIELWDDRAVRVMPNTGQRCCTRTSP